MDSSIVRQLKAIQEIDTQIPSIIGMFSNSKTIMEMLSLYELCIKMKGKISKEIVRTFKNYSRIDNEKIKILKNQTFKLDHLMFEKDSVIFESKIEKSSMGVICNVSKNIENVFGYDKSSIIGKNINNIMPKSMQK